MLRNLFSRFFEYIDFHDWSILYRKPIFWAYKQSPSKEEKSGHPTVAVVTSKAIFIKDVPEYIPFKTMQNFKLLSIKTFKGKLLDLEQYSSYELYLKEKFTSKYRAKIKMYRKSLIHCFDITFKTYFGSIDESTYENVFLEFKKLLDTRLKEKKIPNDSNLVWDTYYNVALEQINKKQAMLSVIYSGPKVIAVSLNFIYDKTLFGYCKAYDIAYSKFGVGIIELHQSLSWCFDKQIKYFDFLKGEEAYKDKYTNTSYYFLKQLGTYRKFSFNYIYVNIAFLFLKSFYGVYRLSKTPSVEKIKLMVEKRGHLRHNNQKVPEFEKVSEVFNSSKVLKKLKKISFLDLEVLEIKRSIINFCYNHKVKLKDIVLYIGTDTITTLSIIKLNDAWYRLAIEH